MTNRRARVRVFTKDMNRAIQTFFCAIIFTATSATNVFAGTISPFEMRGLRDFSGSGSSAFVLNFSAVKSGTEDRTIAHFDVTSVSGNVTGSTLTIGIKNIDPGAPAGTLDVYVFAGDGIVSPDEWNTGILFQSFSDIAGGASDLTTNISSLLLSSISNEEPYLSFGFRTTTTDRYWLNSTVDGITTSISGEDATYIYIPQIVPEPGTLGLLFLGLVSLGLIRQHQNVDSADESVTDQL